MFKRKKIGLFAFIASSVLTTLAAFATPPASTASEKTGTTSYAETAMPSDTLFKPNAKQSYISTADHSKFKALDREFKTGPEVTAACLTCHTEAGKQLMHTKHWSWDVVNTVTKQRLGKKNIINNFCTTPISNEKDCMACHIGYGWKDASFDFNKQENVDCLVCHDTTATYRKLPGDAGNPISIRKEFPRGSGKFVEPIDLKKVAQNVGKTSRATCGTCHFYGAGGNGAKHGDLDSCLKNPGKYLDVHMDAKGLNFTCATCHMTTGHQVPGSRYQVDAAEKGPAHIRGKTDNSPVSCQACHSNSPHPEKMARLNDHARKVACQTCHIPEFARDSTGTELSWDWSTATKMGLDGKPFSLKDSAGRRAFDSKKGTWVWDSYVIPQYRWFNGNFGEWTTRGSKIDPAAVVKTNQPQGSANDPNSRIWPLKVHTGKQAYDKINKTLLVVHTAGEDEDALWQSYNWDKAIRKGMATAGLPYSGEFGFVTTEQSWPITHMVAPRTDALTCAQCHNKNGRLKDIQGVYMPARGDYNKPLEIAGLSLALLALLGVILHGAGRIYMSKKGIKS